MPAEIYRVLGNKGIDGVCRKYNLSPEDKELLERILRNWGNLGHNLDAGDGILPSAMRIIGENPRWQPIIRASLAVDRECRKKNINGILIRLKERGNGHNGPNSSFL